MQQSGHVMPVPKHNKHPVSSVILQQTGPVLRWCLLPGVLAVIVFAGCLGPVHGLQGRAASPSCVPTSAQARRMGGWLPSHGGAPTKNGREDGTHPLRQHPQGAASDEDGPVERDRPSSISPPPGPAASSSSPPSSSPWSMDKDWALVDNVSRFTVSTSTETRTFWTQLWASTPALFSSATGPDALYRRMLQLKAEEEEEAKHHHQERQEGVVDESNVATVGTDHHVVPRKKKKRRLPAFGPSPPVLENWTFDDGHRPGGSAGERPFVNRVVGQIVDDDDDSHQHGDGTPGGPTGGRTVWFHYHVVGRLQGDPLSPPDGMLFPSAPGGYVEAVGGRIYELGRPMPARVGVWQRDDQGGDRHRPHMDGRSGAATSSPIPRTNESDGAVTTDAAKKQTSLAWWVPAGTATVSALVASTILSACIGYGAGLSMIEDTHHHYPSAHGPAPSSSYYYYSSSGRYSSHVKVLPPSSGGAPSSPSSSSITTGTTKGSPEMAGGKTAPGVVADDPSRSQPKQQPAIEEELRARVEFRAMREQQLLDALNQRLERDQRILEQMEGALMGIGQPQLTQPSSSTILLDGGGGRILRP
jgi:hypothetical protein